MKIRINNYSKKIGKRKNLDYYAWKIFIDEDWNILDRIEQVQYLLHETFPNPARIVKDRASKFALKSSGWGNFTVYVTVKFKDGTEEEIEYYLDLNKRWPKSEEQASKSRLVFVGHVSVDKVENVNGTHVQPGGGALYAAIAARTLSPKVTLISAAGKDYDFPDVLDMLESKDIRIYDMPSTRFHIKYDKRWEAYYLDTIQGAGSRITPRRISAKWLKSKSIFHISPMSASKVVGLVDKIKRKSPEAMISIKTSKMFVEENQKSRRILKDLALKADFFILNDSSAKALAQTDSISSALRFLKAKMLVITLGSLGSIISGKDIGLQMVPALNLPPEKIVDTTGAGDVWCGAFLATYDLTEDLTKSVSVASVISSIKCLDWGFRSLIDLRFKEPNDVIEFVVGMKKGSLQKRILDFGSTNIKQ